MRKYAIRRFYQTIIVLWVVMSLLFILFRMMPGDPTSMLVDESLDEIARKKLLVEWGLDAPLYVQYFVFLKNLVQFNFGVSFFYRIPVWEALYSPLFNSMVLMGTGLVIAIGLGIVLGAYLGWKRGGKLERFGLIFSLTLRSTPIFWLGIIVLMVFAYWLALFPTGRMRVTGYAADNLLQTYLSLDFAWHLALPLLDGDPPFPLGSAPGDAHQYARGPRGGVSGVPRIDRASRAEPHPPFDEKRPCCRW